MKGVMKMKCYICDHEMVRSTIDKAIVINNNKVVVRDTPVWVCTDCGEKKFEAKVLLQVQKIAEEYLKEKNGKTQCQRGQLTGSKPIRPLEMSLPLPPINLAYLVANQQTSHY
ncbi:YgiT-type zinc finger protein [Heliobacterium undosum]|uniref:YgiT-type zinc finger protein n=1 Tax=Heliomicrobium undosum TaxID=121734 RepID=A0A845KXQ0_9FIRM|nr:YgiT-type zinc finger protein [Heliomicrobium undosum]MZP28412.1 YgiT-type zinc finger protein [Heliomicrobium undosum]